MFLTEPSLQGVTPENTVRLIMHFYLGFLLLWLEGFKPCYSGLTPIGMSSGSGPTSFLNSSYFMMSKSRLLQRLTTCINTLRSPLTSSKLWLQNWVLRCSILEASICFMGFKHALTVPIPLIAFLSIAISSLIFTELHDRCWAVMKWCNSTYTSEKSSSML